MKAIMMVYKISGTVYRDVIVAETLRTARYIISVKHQCKPKMVKILESKVIIDNRTEEEEV